MTGEHLHLWLEGTYRCVECGAFIGDPSDSLQDRVARGMRYPTLGEIQRRYGAPPLEGAKRTRRIG